jgi:uncharacterized membrane protein
MNTFMVQCMTAKPVRRRDTAMAPLLVGALVGVVAGVTTGVYASIPPAPLVAWDVAAITYLIWTWRAIWRLDAEATAGHATIDDPTQRVSELILLVAGVVSLAAVGVVIVQAAQSHGMARALQTTIGVASVVISWLVVHTIYTLRYARLYHDGNPGGVDFNQPEAPHYHDFAYVAFTIGMTFQVSDTNFTNSSMRTNALRHALLSYLYGTVIIATAINIVAGLAR